MNQDKNYTKDEVKSLSSEVLRRLIKRDTK